MNAAFPTGLRRVAIRKRPYGTKNSTPNDLQTARKFNHPRSQRPRWLPNAARKNEKRPPYLFCGSGGLFVQTMQTSNKRRRRAKSQSSARPSFSLPGRRFFRPSQPADLSRVFSGGLTAAYLMVGAMHSDARRIPQSRPCVSCPGRSPGSGGCARWSGLPSCRPRRVSCVAHQCLSRTAP